MELTRRDAIAALAAIGVGAVIAGRGGGPTDVYGEGALDAADRRRIRETLQAAAEVLYPSTLTGIDEFVDEFVDGRLDRVNHAGELAETVAELNRLSGRWYGGPFPSLSVGDRDRMLRAVGADTADEDPNGSIAERVRYYVVNELLLALYTSPTGGRLVGIENPQGHPGGIGTYQRGPPP